MIHKAPTPRKSINGTAAAFLSSSSVVASIFSPGLEDVMEE